MAGGNFMHRVVSYLVNELLVNSLANRWLLSSLYLFYLFTFFFGISEYPCIVSSGSFFLWPLGSSVPKWLVPLKLKEFQLLDLLWLWHKLSVLQLSTFWKIFVYLTTTFFFFFFFFFFIVLLLPSNKDIILLPRI